MPLIVDPDNLGYYLGAAVTPPADYNTGTITTTGSNNTVTGSGTTWTTAMVGRTIYLGTGGSTTANTFVIATVTSATVLTVTSCSVTGSVVNPPALSGVVYNITANVLTLTGADTYAKAKADSAANAEVVGIVSAVADANNFTLQSGGRIATLSGLTANTVYFLDPSTAGALTATEPTTAGQVSKPLLITSSTTAGYIFIMRGLVVGTALTAAAQSDVVTGTSTTLFVTPSVLKYHPGVAKASVQWTVGGTTINYQNNVSSITRTAAGDYTVNFTSNLANTTDMRVYCNFISASTMLAPAVNTVAVGSARVQIRNTSGTLTDPSGNVWVDVFGTF